MNSIFNKKIYNILFSILIIILPLQTRYFLLIQNINKNFFEYGSLTLYVTDIYLVLFVFYEIIFAIKNKTKLEKKSLIFLSILGVLNLINLVSIFFAIDKTIAFYKIIKIFLFSLTSFLIYINRVSIETFINSFIISTSLQSFVSIYQFILQEIFPNKYLGIASQIPYDFGVSVVEGNFGRVLRSYGSFSHPNALGIFLVIGLFFLLLKIKSNEKKLKEIKTKKINIELLLFIYLFGINLIALIFTFSRICILLFILEFIFYFIYEFILSIKNRKEKENCHRYNLRIFTALIFLILSLGLPASDILAARVDGNNRLTNKSNNERIVELKNFLGFIQNKYLTGVGIGNYTIYKYNENNNLNTWELQPIHNIYLLLFGEIGIFGILTFLALIIFFIITNKKVEILIPVIIILLFGMVDHFIITAQSGLLLMFVLLGLNKNKNY